MTVHFLSINDIPNEDLADLLDKADNFARGSLREDPLKDRTVAMLFEKPSLRTRVSFEMAIHQLGGHSIYLGRDEVGLDVREPVEDVAQILSQWVSMIVARVFDHEVLVRLAMSSTSHVINALSDREHPCQAIADLLTIRQVFGRIEGLNVVYVGDANNCAVSLALGCAAAGAHFTIATPNGYGFTEPALSALEMNLGVSRNSEDFPAQTTDPVEAVQGCDVIYTDAWTSMGQESERDVRIKDFVGFQVDTGLLARANRKAILMHPMPAHYGEEIPEGMLDHPQSVAYKQASNRLHAQKAIISYLTS